MIYHPHPFRPVTLMFPLWSKILVGNPGSPANTTGWNFILFSHCEVLEEEITPVILDVEEKTEDKNHVHEADEDDHNHPSVD